VGDSVNDKPESTLPYRMVGIPDGMGAFDNHDGTFTLLMNHEVAPDRRHVLMRLTALMLSSSRTKQSSISFHLGEARGCSSAMSVSMAVPRRCAASCPS
jgi:hypothetical protein